MIKRTVPIIIVLLLSIIMPLRIFAAEQVILLLWHGLNWDDLSNISIKEPVAMALLNTRFAGGEGISAAYLSIGAGGRAMGFAGSAIFYQEESWADELYKRHTGLESTRIVQPKIAQIQAAQTMNYYLKPGALGSALAEAEVPLRVLGNSDGVDPFSWAALIGMDFYGRVRQGNISSEVLTADASFPYGLRTDYEYLLEQVLEAEEPLVIVDLGDPFRLDQYQKHYILPQKKVTKERIEQEAANFVRSVVEGSSNQTVVFLVSPHPAQDAAERGYWLTPILCWGLGEGLLISATTRWPGLITNMDIAPTLLQILGIEHRQPFIGRVVSIVDSAQGKVEISLGKMASKIKHLSNYRSVVLRTLVIGQILSYAAVLIALILTRSLSRRIVFFLQLALLLLLAMPLSLLLWNRAQLVVLLLISLLCYAAYKGVFSIYLAGAISLVTTVAIGLDVILGSWLIRYSFLGYDPIGGARFYGIGNEFMGVLIGAAIMGWSVALHRWPSLKARKNLGGLFFFILLAVIIGAPSLGTNVGGLISSVFGFGSAWIACTGKKVNFRKILVLAGVALVFLGFLMLIDGYNSQEQQSHIGQTVELIARDGPTAIFMIIIRKLTMNFKLLRYSMWSNALIVALIGMGASLIWPSRFIHWLKETHPVIAQGIIGVVIGSTAAFFFNDSGVVAAATCLSFASSSLLLLSLELKHDLTTPKPYIEDDGDCN